MPIKPLNRRTFIKGMGVTLAIPFLEAMLPMNRSWAAAPSRFGMLFMGNGMLTGVEGAGTPNDYWSCQGNANGITGFSVPMQKLQAYKEYLTLIQNCSFEELLINGGSAGHEQDAPGFSTGHNLADTENRLPPIATNFTAVRLAQPGMSIDRMISATRTTRLRNLMMAVGTLDGRFEAAGTPVQTLGNLSWDSQTKHLTNDTRRTAADVFKQLTASGITGSAPNTGGVDPNIGINQQKSVLDAVLGDVNSMMGRLGNSDKQVMNQYLESLRKIELDLQNSQVPVPTPVGSCQAPSAAKQAAYNSDSNIRYDQVTQTTQNMLELMTLAFQCGLTDVGSLMLSYAESRIPGGQIQAAYGVQNSAADSYHGCSHYSLNPDAVSAYTTVKGVNVWHAAQVAYLTQLLKATPDSDGKSLLDNSCILFGAGMGDPDHHTYKGMMRVLVGKGAGLKPGANGKIINAGGGRYTHAKLLQTILSGFGISQTIGLSGGQTIPGIIG